MASKTSAKIQRDKEMAAMLYNSKEQRVLEKSLQTLQLEQTYALKLLELDHRIIKVRYKKLRDNVSKIKSHLQVDDISSFRDLELQGKLTTPGHSGVNLGSAIKIAAAARRLNLGAGFKKRGRMRSALPTICVQRDLEAGKESVLDLRSKSVVSINDPPVVDRIKRSNSITGAFIDAPSVDGESTRANQYRPASAFQSHHSRHISRPQTVNGSYSSNSQKTTSRNNGNTAVEHKGNNNGTTKDIKPTNTTQNSIIPSGEALTTLALPSESPKPLVAYADKESMSPANRSIPNKETLSLPNAANGGHSNPEDSDLEPMSTFRSTSSIHRSRSPFSSHSQGPRRASAPARPNRRLSHISTDSIDSNLGDNNHEERRQELLEEEGVRAATLDQRTKIFLKDVEEYLIKNPPLQPSHVAFENGLPEPPRRDSLMEPPASQAGLDPKGSSSGRAVRFQQRRGDALPGENQDITPTFFPEAQYKERLMGLWKDMNKCRYLRVPDEKIDLSGINTLAKDQMKLFEVLRNAETEPLKQAWE